MPIDLSQFKDLGVVALLGLFFIQQFFGWLKTQKNNGNGTKEQLKVIGENHLTHIEQAIREQTSSLTDWHIQQMNVLSQIKAGVDNLKK